MNCSGKVRYEEANRALSALLTIIRKGRDTGQGKPVRYYYHPECNGFHLTKNQDWKVTK